MFRIQVACDCARNYIISKVKRDAAQVRDAGAAEVRDAGAVTQMLLHIGHADLECK